MSDTKTPTGEIAAALARSAISMAFPVFGPLVAEVVSNIIPDKRIDRLGKLIAALERRIDLLDPAGARERLLGEPIFSDLLEDAMFQAARATSDDRIEHIASILEHGLRGNALQAVEAKTMLRLLDDLTDVEVIILAAHLEKNRENDDFRRKHREALAYTPALMNSERSEIDKATVQALHRDRLSALGLVRYRYETPKKGQAANFDDTIGTLKRRSDWSELTPRGRLLLRRAGLAADHDI